ncbi:hypothetical protein [Pseudidiomarina woesei]|uniref:Uncharacterized protein n=1 Tax=Pseudidiomarina woesei TaxID=1381080 RepID=A0A0K6HAD2_9GAMM|nr:hypothetical protein [Pseudidiomarina woesei]CUA87851.1 hypothetical protein Ga0061064_1962 [Pseudidiomarina woesei]
MISESLELYSQASWTEIGIFWTSVILALVTVTATLFNYLLLRTQKDPEVIVYATPDDRRPSIINLVIENIGPGLAKRVKFTLPDYFPERAFGFEDAPKPNNMSHGPLVSGIPSLGPNAKRIITWGQYGGLFQALADEPVLIKCKYSRDRIGFPGSKKLTNECLVDIKSFDGTDESDNNWDKKAANELEQIAKALSGLAMGRQTLKVSVKEDS